MVKEGKQAKLHGEAKGLSKVRILYGGKKVKTIKVNKNGYFNTSINFKGYKNLTLYGINKKGIKVTAKEKGKKISPKVTVDIPVVGATISQNVSY